MFHSPPIKPRTIIFLARSESLTKGNEAFAKAREASKQKKCNEAINLYEDALRHYRTLNLQDKVIETETYLSVEKEKLADEPITHCFPCLGR